MFFRGSSSSCLTPSGSQYLHQNSPGVPGIVERDNWFGWGLGMLHLDSDNRLDLITSARNDNLATPTPPKVGRVITFQGASTGLGTATEVFNATNLQLPGVQVDYVGGSFAAPASVLMNGGA